MGVPIIKFPTQKYKSTTYGYICFSLLHKLFQFKYSKKQSDNIISGIHAASAIVLTNTSIRHLRCVSTAYFLFDTIQTFKRGEIGLLQYAYIYHHLASIYLLTCDSREVPLDQIFFWGELSNIFNYPLYHFIHEKSGDHKNKIAILQILQKMVYAGIRLPLCTKNMIKFVSTNDKPRHLLALFPVYIMGVIWSFKILSQ